MRDCFGRLYFLYMMCVFGSMLFDGLDFLTEFSCRNWMRMKPKERMYYYFYIFELFKNGKAK